MSSFLFLDIDGVLNSDQYYDQNESWLDPLEPDERPQAFINPEAVSVLNSILSRSDDDPEIVLSSSWRHTFEPDEMTAILRDRGFDGEIESITPGNPQPRRYAHGTAHGRGHTMDVKRGQNIRNFLVFKRRVDQVHTLLVIDNMELQKLSPFEDYVLQTETETGLLDEHIDEGLAILNKPVTGIDLTIG